MNGTSVEVKVADGPRALLEAVRLLDDKRLEPEGIAIREPTLDDVFLTLTGKRAEEEPVADEEEAVA